MHLLLAHYANQYDVERNLAALDIALYGSQEDWP